MNTKPETEIVTELAQPLLQGQPVQEIRCTSEQPAADVATQEVSSEKDLKMEALTKEFYAIGEEIMRLNNWGELKVTMGQPVEKSEDDFVDELVQLPQDMLHNVLKKLSMKAFKQLSEVEQNQLKQQAATEIEQEAKKEKRKAIKLKKKIKKIKETKNIFVKGPYHKSRR
jgi:hypothetical protein